MKTAYPSYRWTCEPAEAAGICRICIRDQDCRPCAFAQWLDDARPGRPIFVLPEAKPVPVSGAA